MLLDMRLLVFATLGKKAEKRIMTEKTKQVIRDNDYTVKFADYGTIQKKNYTRSYYREEDQKQIDEFIKLKGFKKITETKEEYTIEIVPSAKGIKEYEKMLNEQEKSQYRNIAKVASQLKSKINKIK